MTLFLLAYLGGVLTIVSPCILPVLPFVFTRAGQPFLRSGLPMLVGMALTFAIVGTLAAVAGGWAIAANQYGRAIALALLGVFGLILLFPQLADRAMRPLVALGARLSESAEGASSTERPAILPAVLLGVATGLLWAPCAGPILGLILTGAALKGASVQASLLLLAYAAGSATSLALALKLGGGFFNAMKRSIGAGEWIRRALGAAVLLGVIAIALGLDAGLLTRLSAAGTSRLEQRLLDRIHGAPAAQAQAASGPLPVEGTMPSIAGATQWLNSPPLTVQDLKGKVVLVDFWTYSCINCLRSIPYVRAWAEKYKDQGLVVIGVHAPEFAFEKNPDNVRKAVADLQIGYPVAIDNDFAIWRAFANNYWPAHYFIDAQGRVRHHHVGEGSYDESERVIQQLLAEAGKGGPANAALVSVAASGVSQAADLGEVKSPETYVGWGRAQNFASPGGQVKNASGPYIVDGPLALNRWGLDGTWTVRSERADLDVAGGAIVYRFHARDLHLVLGPGADGRPVRFRVLIDGRAPGASHGADVAADGSGTVDRQRLYQLIRQPSPVQDHTFEIRFLDRGVQAFAFTFG